MADQSNAGPSLPSLDAVLSILNLDELRSLDGCCCLPLKQAVPISICDLPPVGFPGSRHAFVRWVTIPPLKRHMTNSLVVLILDRGLKGQ